MEEKKVPNEGTHQNFLLHFRSSTRAGGPQEQLLPKGLNTLIQTSNPLSRGSESALSLGKKLIKD